MHANDQNNRTESQYDVFDQICTSNLIQEEPDFPFSFHPEPIYLPNPTSVAESPTTQETVDVKEQKHRHKLEWILAIRTSLFPILFSIIVVFTLIRILFMIHDADHLLTFLQTIFGLFGASASGYAYAQSRSPGDNKSFHSTIPEVDDAALVSQATAARIDERENKTP